MDGVSAIALIAIISFTIERIVTGLQVGLSFFRPGGAHFPIPRRLPIPLNARLPYVGPS